MSLKAQNTTPPIKRSAAQGSSSNIFESEGKLVILKKIEGNLVNCRTFELEVGQSFRRKWRVVQLIAVI